MNTSPYHPIETIKNEGKLIGYADWSDPESRVLTILTLIFVSFMLVSGLIAGIFIVKGRGK